MKQPITFIAIALFSALLFHSCEKCEKTVLEGPTQYDCPELNLNIGDLCDDGDATTGNDTINGNCICVGTPIDMFDCPSLMLNIGDDCDDMNTETVNDSVTVSCECMGEIITTGCEGSFYAQFLEDMDLMGYDMATYPLPVPMPFSTTVLEPMSVPFQDFRTTSDYSAYDHINGRYAHLFSAPQDFTGFSLLYLAETSPFSSSILEVDANVTAPVFFNGSLYALSMSESDGLNSTVQVMEINQGSGTTTVLHTEAFTHNSPVTYSIMSSCADGNSFIYFISGTNFMSYDVNTGIFNVTDIDLSYAEGARVGYVGLEYDEDMNRILAVHVVESSNEIDLVEIEPSGIINGVMDIQGPTSTVHDWQAVNESISSTISQCDNTYHLTFIEQFSPPGGLLNSYRLELDLSTSSVTEEVIPGLVIGMELDEE